MAIAWGISVLNRYIDNIFNINQQGDAREDSYYSSLETLLNEYSSLSKLKNIHVTTLPKQTEAALLGCALIGAVTSGVYPDYEAAVKQAVSFKETYYPMIGHRYTEQIQRYDAVYQNLKPVFKLDASLQKNSYHS